MAKLFEKKNELTQTESMKKTSEFLYVIAIKLPKKVSIVSIQK